MQSQRSLGSIDSLQLVCNTHLTAYDIHPTSTMKCKLPGPEALNLSATGPQSQNGPMAHAATGWGPATA